MSDATSTPILSTIVVEAPIDRAFAVFTEDMGRWWPPEHHILESEFAETVIEPQEGGHIYDLGVDGSQCRWARILAYEPPHRFLLSWNINPQWKLETDPERASEVEVRFISESPGRTRVVLEHRNIERHGEGWEEMHAAVGQPGGWGGILRCFSALLEGTPMPQHS